MEHVVQFGICIDDERIRSTIEKSAENKVVADITQQLMNRMFDAGYYRCDAKSTDPLKDWVIKQFDNFLEQHREVILDRAAERLADRMSRTKAAKEMLSQVVGTSEGKPHE